ncbi:cytochrome c oxidase subunit 1 [Thoreauomyces humboldtii]|nr:cytochrome c oxidase subunit 1 [Thoreauomyces humboldtii]
MSSTGSPPSKEDESAAATPSAFQQLPPPQGPTSISPRAADFAATLAESEILDGNDLNFDTDTDSEVEGITPSALPSRCESKHSDINPEHGDQVDDNPTVASPPSNTLYDPFSEPRTLQPAKSDGSLRHSRSALLVPIGMGGDTLPRAAARLGGNLSLAKIPGSIPTDPEEFHPPEPTLPAAATASVHPHPPTLQADEPAPGSPPSEEKTLFTVYEGSKAPIDVREAVENSIPSPEQIHVETSKDADVSAETEAPGDFTPSEGLQTDASDEAGVSSARKNSYTEEVSSTSASVSNPETDIHTDIHIALPSVPVPTPVTPASETNPTILDRRHWKTDIMGSQAYVKALSRTGILTADHQTTLNNALDVLSAEWKTDTFILKEGDADLRTANARRLAEIVGAPLAGKIYTLPKVKPVEQSPPSAHVISPVMPLEVPKETSISTQDDGSVEAGPQSATSPQYLLAPESPAGIAPQSPSTSEAKAHLISRRNTTEPSSGSKPLVNAAVSRSKTVKPEDLPTHASSSAVDTVASGKPSVSLQSTSEAANAVPEGSGGPLKPQLQIPETVSHIEASEASQESSLHSIPSISRIAAEPLSETALPTAQSISPEEALQMPKDTSHQSTQSLPHIEASETPTDTPHQSTQSVAHTEPPRSDSQPSRAPLITRRNTTDQSSASKLLADSTAGRSKTVKAALAGQEPVRQHWSGVSTAELEAQVQESSHSVANPVGNKQSVGEEVFSSASPSSAAGQALSDDHEVTSELKPAMDPLVKREEEVDQNAADSMTEKLVVPDPVTVPLTDRGTTDAGTGFHRKDMLATPTSSEESDIPVQVSLGAPETLSSPATSLAPTTQSSPPGEAVDVPASILSTEPAGDNLGRADTTFSNSSESEANEPPAPTIPVKGTSVRAIEAYAPNDETELALDIGDVVELDATPASADEHWWYGTNRSWGPNNGTQGYFPVHCVQLEKWETDPSNAEPVLLTEAGELATESDQDAEQQDAVDGPSDDEWTVPPPQGTKVKVKATYQKTKADELDLEVGELVVVMEAPEGGWWRGMKNLGGKTPASGWFPAIMVTVCEPDQEAVPAKGPIPRGGSFAGSSTTINQVTESAADGPGDKRRSWYKRIGTGTSAKGKASAEPRKKNRARSNSAPTPHNFDPDSNVDSSETLGLSAVAEGSSGDLESRQSIDEAPARHARSRSATPAPMDEPPSSPRNRLSFFLQAKTAPSRMSLFSPSRSTLGESTFDMSSTNTAGQTYINVDELMVVNSDRWQDRVSAETLAAMPHRQQQRMTAVFELIATERDYVRDLKIIIGLFMRPLAEKKIVSSKVIDTLFSNLEEILVVNQDFLVQLEELYAANPIIEQIGDHLSNTMDKFTSYTPYCSQQAVSGTKHLSMVQNKKEYRQFLEESYKHPVTRRLDLGGFLIKPVQRICKYPLLIREIIKYTDETAPDFELLKAASERMQGIITIVNAGTKPADGVRKMTDIQHDFADKTNICTPSRMLVREDAVFITVADGVKKPRQLFLFNDAVLLAKRDWRDKLHLVAQGNLKDSSLSDIREKESDKMTVFMELDIGERYLVSMLSTQVKQSWLEGYRRTAPAGTVVRTKSQSSSPSGPIIANITEEVGDGEEQRAVDTAAARTAAKVAAAREQELLQQVQNEVEKTREATAKASSETARADTAEAMLAALQAQIDEVRHTAETRHAVVAAERDTLRDQMADIGQKLVQEQQRTGEVDRERALLVVQRDELRHRETQQTAELLRVQTELESCRGQLQRSETARQESDGARIKLEVSLSRELEIAEIRLKGVQAESEIRVQGSMAVVDALKGELASARSALERAQESGAGLQAKVHELQIAVSERDTERARLALEFTKTEAELVRVHGAAEVAEKEHLSAVARLDRLLEERDKAVATQASEVTDLTKKLAENAVKIAGLLLDVEKLRTDGLERGKAAEDLATRTTEELAKVKADWVKDQMQLQEAERMRRDAARQLETGRSQYKQLSDTNRQMAEELSRLKVALAERKDRLSAFEQERNSLQKQLVETQAQVGTATKQVEALKSAEDVSRDAIRKLQEEAHRTSLRAEQRAESQAAELERHRENITRLGVEIQGHKERHQRQLGELRQAKEREVEEYRRRFEALERDNKVVADRLERDKEGLEKEKKTLERDLAASERKRETLEKEMQTLQKQAAVIERERDSLADEKVLKEKERKNMKIRAKHDVQWKKAAREMEAENEGMANNIRELCAANDELDARLAHIEQLWAASQEELAAARTKAAADTEKQREEIVQLERTQVRQNAELKSLRAAMTEIARALAAQGPTLKVSEEGRHTSMFEALGSDASESRLSVNGLEMKGPATLAVVSRVHDLILELGRAKADIEAGKAKIEELTELKELAELECGAVNATIQRLEEKFRLRFAAYKKQLQAAPATSAPSIAHHDSAIVIELQQAAAAAEKESSKLRERCDALEREKHTLDENFGRLYDYIRSHKAVSDKEIIRLKTKILTLTGELEAQTSAKAAASQAAEALHHKLREAEMERSHLTQLAASLKETKQKTQQLLEAANETSREMAEELARIQAQKVRQKNHTAQVPVSLPGKTRSSLDALKYLVAAASEDTNGQNFIPRGARIPNIKESDRFPMPARKTMLRGH